jgi:hypothetical protein
LKERPPAKSRDEVQGLVTELHNEVGVHTLAAYADGGARWLGSRGKAIIWGGPGRSKEVDARIRDFLAAAGPLVERSPRVEEHTKSELPLDHFRVTVLTFGGIHVIEAAKTEPKQVELIGPTMVAAFALLKALNQANDEEQAGASGSSLQSLP